MSERKEWAAMMKGLKAGDLVTITKIDRAARSISDMVGITKALNDIGA
jgi:DNA invertase Pin-like site-specific DNA recombinase